MERRGSRVTSATWCTRWCSSQCGISGKRLLESQNPPSSWSCCSRRCSWFGFDAQIDMAHHSAQTAQGSGCLLRRQLDLATPRSVCTSLHLRGSAQRRSDTGSLTVDQFQQSSCVTYDLRRISQITRREPSPREGEYVGEGTSEERCSVRLLGLLTHYEITFKSAFVIGWRLRIQ
jgi:hypothetical protein